MASATTTTQLPILKRLWGSGFADPMYKASKVLNSAKKDTNFGGEGRYIIIAVAMISGVGATFADALAAQGPSQEVRMFVTHRKEYAIFTIQNDLIARTRGNANAVVEALKRQMDTARRHFARRMSRRLWGNGGGAIGQLHSSVTLSSTTLRLRNRVDVAGIEAGLQVGFASDDGSSGTPAGLRGGGVPTYLAISGGIDRDDGTATVSAALNTVPSITANDYVFVRGDYNAAMTGLRGYNPVSDPSASESFMGLDRTVVDIQRTSGVRVSGSGKTKLETIEDACAEAKINGLESDDLMLAVNPLDYAAIRKELGTSVIITDVKGTNGIGFKAIQIFSHSGTVTIVSEVDVPLGYAWLFDPSELYLRTAGDAPMELTEGGKLLTAYDDDAKQGRLGAYGNFFVENPGGNVVITW